jgi:DNA-binding NarL/FixJ family response regulator
VTPDGIRVLVADGRSLYRAALGAALDAEDDLVVVDQVAHEEAVELAHRLEPDVLCVGSAMLSHDAVALCEHVMDERPDQRMIVVDEIPDPGHLLAAVRAGVEGYVTQDEPLSELVAAIRRIHGGEAVIPADMLPGLLRSLLTSNRRSQAVYERYLRLTSREREVMELLAEGCSNGTIAEILVISPQTSRTHIQNVVRKLGVHSRLEVARMAAEHGWVRNARR